MLARHRVARGLLAALALVTVVHLLAQLTGSGSVAGATQVLLMPLLAGFLWARTDAPRGRLVVLGLLALGLSWLGDSAPRVTSGDTAFLVMIGFFLCTQVVYIIAFLPFRKRSVLHVHRAFLLLYGAAIVALVAACAGGAAQMLGPVLVYGVLLGLMAVLSSGVNTVAAVGGALFLVSDGLIALDAFAPGWDLPAQGFWVMATYVAAQVLLVAGILQRQRAPDPATTQADAARSR